MSTINTEDLRKVFETPSGEITAVDSVNVSIDDGEFVTIVGPSGCGKTTLLRMIAGLEKPTSGRLFFDEDDVTDLSPQKRHISMVFQDIALFPFRSVQANIDYGMKYSDIDSKSRERRSKQMAELLGIDTLLEKKPGQLSGGQQQRVALARALAGEPELFLLDEPMSDLDEKLKRELRTELKELHKQFQTTTLYVTHDQEEAMTLSERVIVMNDGQVQQAAPPTEVYEQPANIMVAEFIGSPSINLFTSTMTGTEIDVEGLDQPLPLPETAEDAQGLDAVTVAVRPEDLAIGDDDDDGLTITGDVKIYEHMGDRTVLHLTLPSEGTEFRAVVPTSVEPELGKRLDFALQLDSIHLYDTETGEALIQSLGETKRTSETST